MERTVALKRVGGQIVRQTYVAHLWVRHTAEDLAAEDGAAANPGADCEIQATRNIPRRAHQGLVQRGGINVRIEADGNP